MSNAKRLALFVGVVVLVVGAAAIAGVVTNDQPEPAQEIQSEYDTQSLLQSTEIDEGDGEITVDGDESKTILIDRQHGNAIDEATLQPLVTALTEAGHEVTYLGPGDRLNQSLADADAFVIAQPQQRYTTDQANGVREFAESGGRVLLLDEPSGGGAQQAAGLLIGGGIAPQGDLASISSPLGMTIGTGYLYNMADNGGNFQTVRAEAGDADLAEGVDAAVFHDAAPVYAEDGQPLVTANGGTRYSETHDGGEYHVAVRSGNVVAVGDTDFLANPENVRADNDVLVSNIATFLVSGEKDPANAPQDEGGGGF